MKRWLCVLLCVLLPASLLPAAAAATTPAFLAVDGLEGESAVRGFEKTIEILSFSWGVSNAEVKKPSFTNVSVMKLVDKTSPKLMEHVAAGTLVPRAKLSVVESGGDGAQLEYLRYCFAGVRFTSDQTSWSMGGGRPIESVSFSYEYIVQRYSTQAPDGSQGDSVFGGWDTVKNLVLPPGDC
jgi:type VI secretion system secreted protein Hcp